MAAKPQYPGDGSLVFLPEKNQNQICFLLHTSRCKQPLHQNTNDSESVQDRKSPVGTPSRPPAQTRLYGHEEIKTAEKG